MIENLKFVFFLSILTFLCLSCNQDAASTDVFSTQHFDNNEQHDGIVDIHQADQSPTFYYHRVKHLEVFIRRLTFQEDDMGRLIDKKELNNSEKERMISLLFDRAYLMNYSPEKFLTFVEDLNEIPDSIFNRYSEGWIAQVDYDATLDGKPTNLTFTLLLRDTKNRGAHWAMIGAMGDFLRSSINIDDSISEDVTFLSPEAHELDFIRLEHNLKNSGRVNALAHEEYEVDYLSLLEFYLQNSDLEITKRRKITLHLMNAPGWKIALNYQDRKEENSGWLISELLPMSDDMKNEFFRAVLGVRSPDFLFPESPSHEIDKVSKSTYLKEEALLFAEHFCTFSNLSLGNRQSYPTDWITKYISFFASTDSEVVNYFQPDAPPMPVVNFLETIIEKVENEEGLRLIYELEKDALKSAQVHEKNNVSYLFLELKSKYWENEEKEIIRKEIMVIDMTKGKIDQIVEKSKITI